MPTWDEHGNQLPEAPVREWDADGRPIRPGRGRAAPAARLGRPRGYTEAHGAMTNVLSGLTLGANDEFAGASYGVTQVPGALLRGENPGAAYLQGYDQAATQTRDFRNQFLNDRPMAGNFAQGTGAALPVVAAALAGRPDAAVSAATRNVVSPAARGGLAGLGRRSLEAGSVGSLYGYATGAANADGESLLERMGAGNQGAGLGATVGAFVPPGLAVANQVGRGLRPAWEGAANLASRLPTADPNAVGAMGGNIRPPRTRATPQGPRRMDPVVGGAIERLANRSRQTSPQLAARLRDYRLDPQGQVLADAFDTPGVQTLRSMTQTPGQTGGRAADVARQRFTEAPERILSDLNRRMAVAETPEQALNSLNEQYRRASAEQFQPLWEQPISPQARQTLMERFSRYQENPVMQDAATRAQRIFALDRANGVVEGSISENLPRFLHYMKMGLDDAAFSARTPQSGIGRTELRGITEMRGQFLRTLDEAIPGYQQARSRWGGIIEAQDALETGGQLLNQNSQSIQQHMRSLTPFARYHARVGFANALANRVGLRGSVNGNRNVAEALGSPEMQRRVAAMFDSPDEAAGFLDTLNQQNTLMRNAQQWNGGSSTFANAAHGADNAENALAEGALDVMTNRPASAIGRFRNAITGGQVERSNNRVGEALLRRVDNDADFANQVVEELRRREAARAAQATAGRFGGAAGGAVGNQ